MINIYKLNYDRFIECNELINSDSEDSKYFNDLGWSEIQIKNQFNKNINYALGAFDKKKLIAFVVGDLISIAFNAEYEILYIYVKKSYRRNGLASKLIDSCLKLNNKIKLKKIFLEVAKNNISAINLYKKKNFKLLNVRKNYYKINNKKIDALCYIKER